MNLTIQINCLALDYNPLALEQIQSYIQKIASHSVIQTCTNLNRAIEYLKLSKPNLLFLDVNMPNLIHSELLSNNCPYKPLTIFTTVDRKYVIDAFDLDAVDYLIKPFTFDRFEKAINKATMLLRNKHNDYLQKYFFIKSDYQLVKVMFSDIEYIESSNDYLKIHFSNGKSVMTLMTVKAILEKLPSNQFLRIHRSYIVSIPKIKSLNSKTVQLFNAQLPVSENYSNFLKRI